MKFYHSRIINTATRAVLRGALRPLSQQEMGVFVIDNGNYMKAGESLLLDAIAVYGTAFNREDLNSIAATTQNDGVGRVYFCTADETFHVFNEDGGFTEFVPEAPGGGGGTPNPIYNGLRIFLDRNDSFPQVGESVSFSTDGGPVFAIAGEGFYEFAAYPAIGKDITVTLNSQIGPISPRFINLPAFAITQEVNGENFTNDGWVSMSIVTNANNVNASYSISGSNRVGALLIQDNDPRGLTIGLSFDADPPIFNKVSAYWSIDGNTTTIEEDWNGVEPISLFVPFDPAQPAGSSSLVVACNQVGADTVNKVFSSIEVTAGDKTTTVVGTTKYTAAHEFLGIDGVFAGIVGGVGTWNDTNDFSVNITFTADDVATRNVLAPYANGGLRAVVEVNNVQRRIAWANVAGSTTVVIPGLTHGQQYIAFAKLERFSDGWELVGEVPVFNGHITPQYNNPRDNYQSGLMRYSSPNGFIVPDNSGALTV